MFKPGAVQAFSTTQARKEVRKTSVEIARIARRHAPGGLYSNGVLKKSITWSIQTAGYYVRSRVGTELPYAIYVHQGTKPHLIFGRNGKELRFFWRKRGVIFRGAFVRHPGQEAQPFLVNAMLAVAEPKGYAVKIYR